MYYYVYIFVRALRHLGKEDNGVTIRQALDRFQLQHVEVSRFASRLAATSLMNIIFDFHYETITKS